LIVFRVGKNNPEYMAVLTRVVSCLYNELKHPKISPPSSHDLTDWLHHVSHDEVEAALARAIQAEGSGD
jgi:hypothetical protein